jgi:hypothetical protein
MKFNSAFKGLNLSSIVFGLTPFGSLRAATPTHSNSIVSYGSIIFRRVRNIAKIDY